VSECAAAVDVYAGRKFRSAGSDGFPQRKRRPQPVFAGRLRRQVHLVRGRRQRWSAHRARGTHGHYRVCFRTDTSSFVR